MSKKISHYKNIIKLIDSKNIKEFIISLREYFSELNIEYYTLWKVTNNIAEPFFSNQEMDLNLDIYDLGYNNKDIISEKVDFEFFDETITFYKVFFYKYNNVITFVLTINEEIKEDILELFKEFHNEISYRLYELIIKEKTTNIYVDYQKKIDFIKSGTVIFSTIDINTLINTSQKFFMDAFSAEASGTIYKEKFVGIGFTEEDLKENIHIKDKAAFDYIMDIKSTEFIDNTIISDKFLINNLFVVYDDKHNFKFILFNIATDNIPDKEFSALISSILSIALENAMNHEKMLNLKIEETEMEKTVDILNKFVPNEIQFNYPIKAFGVSYPAKKTGGDYFNIVVQEDKILICVADVCGKGYDAAVVTVVLSVINEMAATGKLSGSLTQIETYLNEYILSKNLDGRFVTAFFAVFNKVTYELEYLSLGHEPAVLVQNDDKVLLESTYLPIGIMNEEYESQKVKLNKGDNIFIYTDGIVEYIDYPELYKYVMDNNSKEPDTIIKNLYDLLVTDKDSQKDDFTCVMLKF